MQQWFDVCLDEGYGGQGCIAGKCGNVTRTACAPLAVNMLYCYSFPRNSGIADKAGSQWQQAQAGAHMRTHGTVGWGRRVVVSTISTPPPTGVHSLFLQMSGLADAANW